MDSRCLGVCPLPRAPAWLLLWRVGVRAGVVPPTPGGVGQSSLWSSRQEALPPGELSSGHRAQ